MPAELLMGQAEIACPTKLQIQVSLYFKGNKLEKILLKDTEAFSLNFVGAPEHQEVIDWFDAYLNGTHLPFPLPLYIGEETFTKAVLNHLLSIPMGHVQTYGEIAALLDNPRGARAVGRACGSNLYPLVIPCHRVIRSTGGLGGFAFGSEIKQKLLNFESRAI